ncbi:MAG: cation-translocating P-type ATPase [Caldilineaceae bacterium]
MPIPTPPAALAPDGKNAYQQSAQAVIAALNSDLGRGLTTAEAQQRLAQSGPNQLEAEAATPVWRKFLAQFQDVLVILLLIAAAISVGVWFYERAEPLPYEGLVIFAIVLLNGLLGYVQEARAEKSVAALQAMTAAEATLLRDGQPQRTAAANLVPGDIILIEEGDTIPADGRLISTVSLQTAEASLTGESLPVAKDTEPIAETVEVGNRSNMVFSGTAAAYGRGRAVITATGMQTEMGKIAGLLRQTQSEATPLQQELNRTGKRLGVIVLVIAVVMVATILLLENVREISDIIDVLILGVALAVAAVPEGLTAIVTAVLAIGMSRMAKRRALIRKLPAVETLGSATVIASDKTGTLTKNEMTVRAIVTASGRVAVTGVGYAPEGALLQEGQPLADGALRNEVTYTLSAADRANNAVLQERGGRWIIQGDPTEGALIVAARKAGLTDDQLTARFARIGEVPFSSERKLMSTVHTDAEQPERLLVFIKGAPDILLNRCQQEWLGDAARPLNEERRQAIRTLNEGLAGEALRTLGVAFRSLPRDGLQQTNGASDELEHELVFLGLVGMSDPPRPEVQEAVKVAQRAGIRSIMITGDHPKTAAAIARELGIATTDTAISGAELEGMSDEVLRKTVQEASVYARVNPEHKLRIVNALRANGAVVAMTGDGVNDAPALKTADIGIAMGITGTDVSKEAADMVLADDNFATIVAAVEEGRTIFANIQKFLRYLLSSNVGEVLTMFLGVLLAKFLGLGAVPGEVVVFPLLATQILWINLVTDGAPALALGLDPADENVMQQQPRPRGSGVITKPMWFGIALVGVVMAVGTLFILDFSLPGGFIAGSGAMDYARTMAFTTLVLFQLFNVLNARSDSRSAFRRLFDNPWLWGALAFSLGLQFAVIYLPFLQRAFDTVALSLTDWGLCVLVGSSVLWLCELSKWISRRQQG